MEESKRERDRWSIQDKALEIIILIVKTKIRILTLTLGNDLVVYHPVQFSVIVSLMTLKVNIVMVLQKVFLIPVREVMAEVDGFTLSNST